MSTLARHLKAIGACEEAVLWAKDFKTLRAAWKVCEQGDWMLWLCANMDGKKGWPTRQQTVLVACDCAELALPIYEKKYPNDKRVRECIEVTRKWANGEATIEEVRQARSAASAAAYTAYASTAYTAYASTAYAAAYAASAAYAYTAYTAYASTAYAAAYAASAAAADAADAAYTAARLRVYKQCADLCRKQLKIPASL
jgi:hypothetical protein